MKYSLTLLALGATSISALAFPAPNAQSSSSCDTASLTKCAKPISQQVLDCALSDLECLCAGVSGLTGCYDQFCPGQAPDEIKQAIDACNSESQDVADPTGGSLGGDDSTATGGEFGDDEPTSTGLGPDGLASETSAARVTKTTSAADDSEETSSAEPEQSDSVSGETGAPEISTRRPSGTQTVPAPTQSTGAADSLTAPVGGLLAAAIGVVALL